MPAAACRMTALAPSSEMVEKSSTDLITVSIRAASRTMAGALAASRLIPRWSDLSRTSSASLDTRRADCL